MVFALPKGLVDPGEKPLSTAVREVHEETGLLTSPITKLGDIKYTYVRTWQDHERVFKIVSFYLLAYRGGEIGEIEEAMRVEVQQALWIGLPEAQRKLTYPGEREMAQRAEQYLESHLEI